MPNPTTTTNDNASSQQDGALDVTIQLPTDYYANDSNNNIRDNTNRSSSHAPTNNNTRRVPALSNNEAMRWCNNYAAQAAARRREPMNTVRLLGVITLLFEEKVRSYDIRL